MWVPAFLRKSSTTTWDVFDVDFNQTVHDFEWNGDEGLKNLWGLYYKCPDAQFIRSFKSNCKTSPTPGLEEGKMKGTIKATNNGPQGCHEFHHPHPISDDATTVASTFSLLITSLTPGTTALSSTDTLIKYNADFQKALEKHPEDILCLIRKCTTSGTPAIPTKMIGKVREANLATMKSIDKEASRHGGKELTTKKMKELGAQSEKESKAIFVAKTDQNGKMEQEELPLAIKQPHPSAPNPPELWAPRLGSGFSVMQMELDGNCFYCSVSDQLFCDQGAGHLIVRHQTNNHIQRNGEEFKNFY
jgi:hypothetical protein